MKKAVLISAVMLSFFNTAMAHDRCGMPQGRPCAQFYSRLDAFRLLQANENGTADAEGNLNVVENASRQLGVSLEYATDNFIYLQQQSGGASATSEVRAVFQSVVSAAKIRGPLHEATSAFVELVRYENGIADASGNFSLVANMVQTRNVSYKSATEIFNSLIRSEGGASSTSDARAVFQQINRIYEFHPGASAAAYRKLRASENDSSGALGNFQLVHRAGVLCGDIVRAANDFNEVLAQTGGSSSTSEARQLFSRLYGI